MSCISAKVANKKREKAMKAIEDAVRELGGVWPSDEVDAVYLYKIHNRYIALGLPGGTALYICTRTEFKQCARRLRNEPSWDDAPDWAVAYAQSHEGVWYWFEDAPPGDYAYTPDGRIHWAATGEVIGDWKQTLRLRPEREKMEDENDWYKRGERPPAGTVCEVLYDGTWKQTKIIGWDDDKIVFATPFDDIASYEGAIANPNIFRPLQTERERWVAAAQQAIGCEPNAHRHMLGQLYDAGLAKMPEDE